jgi:hypothetical protein
VHIVPAQLVKITSDVGLLAYHKIIVAIQLIELVRVNLDAQRTGKKLRRLWARLLHQPMSARLWYLPSCPTIAMDS